MLASARDEGDVRGRRRIEEERRNMRGEEERRNMRSEEERRIMRGEEDRRNMRGPSALEERETRNHSSDGQLR